jgi:hypothetical protein
MKMVFVPLKNTVLLILLLSVQEIKTERSERRRVTPLHQLCPARGPDRLLITLRIRIGI